MRKAINMGNVCTHKDVSKVFEIGACEIWGGRESQVMPRADEFEVIISLLGAVAKKDLPFKLTRGSRRMFSALTAYRQRRNNIVSIDWPDMGIPRLDRQFWEALAEDLSGVKGRAAVFCMGGHGRTGSALSALIQVSNYQPALDSGDVIEWVRTHYCGDAVETPSQVDYLRNTMGLVTKSKGSRGWVDLPSGADPERGMSRYFRQSTQEDERETLSLDQLSQLSLDDE